MRAQLSFFPRPAVEHGGVNAQGKRKTRRPFDPKRPLHVTLRSSKARGTRSLLLPRNKWRVHALLEKAADRHHIRVYRYANVGNHVHLLIQARSRQQLQGFLREFAGAVASAMTGAIKGRPEKFWDFLAHSKIVEWGRQFERTIRYILLNVLEGSSQRLRDREFLARLERDGVVWINPRPS